jgi:hypothetical protein
VFFYLFATKDIGFVRGEKIDTIIELDDGKIYRKALYLMVKTMVACRFSQENQSIDTRALSELRRNSLLALLGA